MSRDPKRPAAPDDPDRDADDALCAEYVLGLLDRDEARVCESRLAGDAAFRARHALWVERIAALTDGIAPEPPPPAVWARIEARLFPEARQSLVRRIGLVPALVGGLIAALIVVLVGSRDLLGPAEPPAAALRARIAAGDGSLLVTAGADPATGALLLERTRGGPPEGRVLELWLIPGEGPPVSLGLMPQEARGRLAPPSDLVALLPGAMLALSDEPPGGSPTGAPTGTVRALGRVEPEPPG